jgi:hypothetical protein
MELGDLAASSLGFSASIRKTSDDDDLSLSQFQSPWLSKLASSIQYT